MEKCNLCYKEIGKNELECYKCQGYLLAKERIIDLIDEDLAYQRSKLSFNLETDKPIKWRIIGFEDLKKRIEEGKK